MENKEKRASGQQQRLEAVRPSMPDTSVLYDLSDFFKVMGDGTRRSRASCAWVIWPRC